MPRQETFLSESANDVVIEVLKTYDRSYAREVFHGIGNEAQKQLATALQIAENYEAPDIPDPDGEEYEDFLWQELCGAASEDVREDPNLLSFFVVSESKAGKTKDLYVSPDWPSAEEFAKRRLAKLVEGPLFDGRQEPTRKRSSVHSRRHASLKSYEPWAVGGLRAANARSVEPFHLLVHYYPKN